MATVDSGCPPDATGTHRGAFRPLSNTEVALNKKYDPAFAQAVLEVLQPFLIEVEGIVLTAYQDSAGVWTIGVGHTGLDVRAGLTITHERALELLRRDIQSVLVPLLARLDPLKVTLTPHQVAALASFAFNEGLRALLGSTLFQYIGEGHLESVPAQFLRWNKLHVHGRLMESVGLTRRREREVALWRTP